MMKKQSNLTVATRAKDLCNYIMTVTNKSPKRFRFTLVSRMNNLVLDSIENIYRANEVDKKNIRFLDIRREYQHDALVNIKLLGYISMLAMEQGCILKKQYEIISNYVSDCQNLLCAWMRSDIRRFRSGRF